LGKGDKVTELNVPQGFVEFSMQVMSRAVKLREDNSTGEGVPGVAYSDLDGKAHWFHFNANVADYVEVAARAMLLAVRDQPVIEGEANG
jgi:hypothetical protein